MPPLLQRGFDSLEDTNTANPTTLANGVGGVKLMDVKDCEEHADRPPKSLGGGPRVFWGEYPLAPDNHGGPRPGGLLARPAGGPMRGSGLGAPCPVNAREAYIRPI
jgi:hypothetical protein